MNDDFELEEPIELIGLRAFAREVGVKLGSIQDAIDAGRLTAVVNTSKGRKLRRIEAIEEWSQCHSGERQSQALQSLDDLDDDLDDDADDSKRQWGIYKTKQEALLAKVRRKSLELQCAELEGKLHRDEDVENVWADILVRFRTRMLAIPSKAAPILASLADRNPNKIQAELEQLIREALTELSQYDKGKITAQRRRRTAKS